MFSPNKLHTRLILAFLATAGLLVLLALLFPVTATDARHGSGDWSNMRQLNLCLIMYAGDSDDLYPRASEWMDEIQPYAQNEYILHSLAVLPADRTAPVTKTAPYGIAFRKRLASVNQARVAQPEQIAAVFDSTDLSRSAAGELNLLPDPPRHKGDKGLYNLIGFVDGHVMPVPKPVVVVR